MDDLTKIKEYIGSKFFSEKNFQFFYNLGIDFYSKLEYQKAIDNFKLAIEQPDVKPQVYYNLALSYQCLKDYDRAVANYNNFLSRVPNDYDGLYNIALVYFFKENYPKAIEFFEKCIAIRIDEDGVKSLVLAYLNNNEMQKAIDFAENVFEQNVNGVDLYYKIADIFENRHSFNKDFTLIDLAIQMYEKILQKEPKYFDAYLASSICYAKKGEFAKSVDFCEMALEANPKSYEANNQMGLVYYCCNEIDEAVNYYEKALMLKPEGDYKVYSNLAYAYEKIGKYDSAIKIFHQLIKKFPQFPAKEEIANHLKVLKTL